jgi:hypothetical protein
VVAKGFRRAIKYDSKLRFALIGPPGSGKTMTALILSSRIAATAQGRVAVIDTERGSASKYADQYDFDVLELDNYHPENYIAAIHMAEEAGYAVLIIDSLSHAWAGKDGALELVDRFTKKINSHNPFAAWKEVTPIHNRMVDAVTGANLHIIATLRSKMEYIQTTDDRGRSVIRKVGMQPVQRDGLEYEFDVVADMTLENKLVVSKSRCSLLHNAVFEHPDARIADILLTWLNGKEPPAPSPKGALREQLIRLAALREALGIEKAELSARARELGVSSPAEMTLTQLWELRTWMMEESKARAESEEATEYAADEEILRFYDVDPELDESTH